MEEAIKKETGSAQIDTPKAGQFLQHKLFSPGNSMPWMDLVHQVLGQPFNAQAWLQHFANLN